MAGSVENIKLGKEIGKELRKNYKTEPKSSPMSTRRADSINGNDSTTDSATTPLLSHLNMAKDSVEFDIANEARSLGRDFVHYKVGFSNTRPTSLFAETLRRVGDEIEEKYNISLNGIINQLKYDPNKDGRRAFNASLDAMFAEGPCSWGRVVMVYVFASRLAKYCQKQNRDSSCIENLVNYSGDYVANNLTMWIKEQGGWLDFCDKFKANDWRDKAVFNSLLVTGLFLGGMATLRLFTK
ncbi:apoptosis regulator BAX-like [Apostichopus japonicus]|uniref:Bax n=2 Tax=Stichopus japonicus TaxID=307972 RepID=A0A499R7W0_STIJA|nr:Bax [Apostichopus japonicus]